MTRVLIACLLSLSAVAQASTPPGTLVTWTASVSVGGVKAASTWERQIYVNPLFEGRVFYCCGDWKSMMPGIKIRWSQCVGKSYVTCEGITTNNGQILTQNGGLIKLTRTNGRL